MKHTFSDILNVDEERYTVSQSFLGTDLHKNKIFYVLSALLSN